MVVDAVDLAIARRAGGHGHDVVAAAVPAGDPFALAQRLARGDR